ncbi:hypothetical protein PFISCL1PPCAC_2855, partial [Pristionchus fissidentatus]
NRQNSLMPRDLNGAEGGETSSPDFSAAINSVLSMALLPRPPSPSLPPSLIGFCDGVLRQFAASAFLQQAAAAAAASEAAAAAAAKERLQKSMVMSRNRSWAKVSHLTEYAETIKKREADKESRAKLRGESSTRGFEREMEVLCDQTEIRDCIVKEMLKREDESMSSLDMLDLISPLVEMEDADTKRRKIAIAINEILVETGRATWSLDRSKFIFDIDPNGEVRVMRRLESWETVARPAEARDGMRIVKEDEEEKGRGVIAVEIEEGPEIKLNVEDPFECDNHQRIVESPSTSSGGKEKKVGRKRTSLDDPEAEKQRRRDMRKSYGHTARIKAYALIRRAREAEKGDEDEIDDEATAKIIKILAGNQFSKWTFKRISTEFTRSPVIGKTEWRGEDPPPEISALLSKILVNSRNLLWIDNCKNESWSLNRDHFSFFSRSDGSVRIRCLKGRTFRRRKKNDEGVTAVEGDEWILGGDSSSDSTMEIVEESL